MKNIFEMLKGTAQPTAEISSDMYRAPNTRRLSSYSADQAAGAAKQYGTKPEQPDIATISTKDLVKIWQKDQGNTGMRDELLKRMDKTMSNAIQSYAPGTGNKFRVKAANLTLNALRSYDPEKGSEPATHVMINLQRLSRYNAANANIMPEPEGVVLDRSRIQDQIDRFTDERGREPSTAELADLTGLSVKRIDSVMNNRTKVMNESATLQADTLKDTQANSAISDNDYLEYVYASSDPVDQKIIEWTSGLHGNKTLSNNDIAKKLRISPAAVSQRRNKIDYKVSEIRQYI